MSRPASQTNVVTIADSLKAGKKQQQRPILFLGARAGGLFDSRYLYETLQQFSFLSFANLSTMDKFAECHSILQKYFNKNEIHDILIGALSSLKYREEDELLARLVKAGFFETIITTNIDNLLEDAYMLCGMKELDNFQVFHSHINGSSMHNKLRYGRIIKVFGDLPSLQYSTAGNEFSLETDQTLKEFLITELAKEVLVIGYDPVWDQPVEQAFLEQGGPLWYVNEDKELPAMDSHLGRVLKQRGNNRYLLGVQGSYRHFLRNVYNLLGGDANRNVDAIPSVPQSQYQRGEKVFISYNRDDKRYLERLQIHLKGYLHILDEKDILDIWDETKVAAHIDWKNELSRAVEHTKVVVLLVSANYLASDFVQEYILPLVLNAAQTGTVRLIPVILSPIDEPSSWYQYQVVNAISQPLMLMSLYEQEVVWAKLAELIFDMLSS